MNTKFAFTCPSHSPHSTMFATSRSPGRMDCVASNTTGPGGLRFRLGFRFGLRRRFRNDHRLDNHRLGDFWRFFVGQGRANAEKSRYRNHHRGHAGHHVARVQARLA